MMEGSRKAHQYSSMQNEKRCVCDLHEDASQEKLAILYLRESYRLHHGPGSLLPQRVPSVIFQAPVASETFGQKAREDFSMNCEALEYYNLILPSQLEIKREILMRSFPEAKNPVLTHITAGEEFQMPRHYYQPWPLNTPTLNFPRISLNDITEEAIVCLVEYKTHLQSEDSCEIGLQIIAYIHRNIRDVYILPTPRIWSLLHRTYKQPFRIEFIFDECYLQDIQRRLCPYLSASFGSFSNFSAMFLHGEHWYVLFMNKCDSLLMSIIRAIKTCHETATRMSSHNCLPNSEVSKLLEGMYTTSFQRHRDRLKHMRCCIVDSLNRPLSLSAWEQMKEFIFFLVYHGVLSYINSASTSAEHRIFSTRDRKLQRMHTAIATFGAISELVWPSRVHVLGPRQRDNRSCGAYCLATIWNLCEQISLESFSLQLLRGYNNVGSSDEVPVSDVSEFYNEASVENVMKEIDAFIRREIREIQSEDVCVEIVA